MVFWDFPRGTSGKEPACQCRRHKRYGFDPWSERFPGEEHGNALQYSCLKNPMDRGSWQATVHRVAKSWTQLKRLGMHTHGSRYSAFMGVEEYVLLLPALRKYFYLLRSDLEATESASLLQFFTNFTFSPRKTTFSHLDVHNISFRIMSFVYQLMKVKINKFDDRQHHNVAYQPRVCPSNINICL